MSFISYSKNHRIPNIQEIYFSTRDIFGPNLNLEPETAKTWQFCFNSFKENLTTDDDIFGFKAVYYNTHINDYIHIF